VRAPGPQVKAPVVAVDEVPRELAPTFDVQIDTTDR
jgi:hypothetical protein